MLTKDGIEVYNTSDIKFVVSRDAVLRGWREDSLWRIPLEDDITKANVQNPNTQTIVTSKAPDELLQRKNQDEFMCNLYELRKQPEIVRFLHAATGFPTKRTWLKAIKKGVYSSWPGLTARAVEKYFPESEETQKATCEVPRLASDLLRKHATITANTTIHTGGRAEICQRCNNLEGAGHRASGRPRRGDRRRTQE